MESNGKSEITHLINKLSSGLNPAIPEIAIILAAGHGKRIKSHRSKMLHKIWEVPTVERVYNACRQGIKDVNILVVVGIKAKDVMEVIGKREATLFAYQENQNGTGHAVQVALDRINGNLSDGIVYVLPGDMGLIDSETLIRFRDEFKTSGSDMLVLTGKFEGNVQENNYGRILRVKERDDSGKSSGSDEGKVIEIIE
jgi:bifunctional UDP-N-acetylglucosamine pyrophosphorylase/glucosamine-1-phosphate N-acetyltransferase